MHMIQVTFHLFRDNFSLLSILSSHLFPYPHACLLLTHAQSNVNMQYLPRMTFISFPIAHSPHPVNHPSYVFPITLLILQNDTPDIASPPTYYATQPILRPPETFPFPHQPNPPIFGTKVPCLPIQPMHSVLMCSTSYPVPRCRARVDSCAPRHLPTHVFHVKPLSTIPAEREREREREESTCARAAVLAALVRLRRLRFAPTPAPRRSGERGSSGALHRSPIHPTQNETQNTLLSSLPP